MERGADIGPFLRHYRPGDAGLEHRPADYIQIVGVPPRLNFLRRFHRDLLLVCLSSVAVRGRRRRGVYVTIGLCPTPVCGVLDRGITYTLRSLKSSRIREGRADMFTARTSAAPRHLGIPVIPSSAASARLVVLVLLLLVGLLI